MPARLNGRLRADPAFGGHNAGLIVVLRSDSQSLARTSIAMSRRRDRSLEMRHASDLRSRLMHRPGPP
jgi:hypothetical protein